MVSICLTKVWGRFANREKMILMMEFNSGPVPLMMEVIVLDNESEPTRFSHWHNYFRASSDGRPVLLCKEFPWLIIYHNVNHP